MREVLIGLTLALITCLFLYILPIEWARGLTANLLTLIAAIYVGFAIASQGRLGIPRQVIGCSFFVAFALLGLWLSWWFLVFGLALHAGWDLLHHGRHRDGVVPRWYIPFCAAYDFSVALFVALYFAART